MAQLRKGTITDWHNLSPNLALFRLRPEPGSVFPAYQAGQYMALRREDCRLTRRVVGQDGRAHFVPDVDADGRQKHGPVTHSYSISSAPYETAQHGYLEFYVVLESGEEGLPGRLTESLFQAHSEDSLTYVDRIVGDFTLEKRARGFENVVWVGTGSGLAPFASMIKQLHFEAASAGKRTRYTLFHANRSREELGYHEELLRIEASGRLDFVYLPSVSRPKAQDLDDPALGVGRANNVLRYLLGMPLKEEQDLEEVLARGEDATASRAALAKAVRPSLPRRLPRQGLRERLNPERSVILTCGNASLMADIRAIADAQHIRFEKEDW